MFHLLLCILILWSFRVVFKTLKLRRSVQCGNKQRDDKNNVAWDASRDNL